MEDTLVKLTLQQATQASALLDQYAPSDALAGQMGRLLRLAKTSGTPEAIFIISEQANGIAEIISASPAAAESAELLVALEAS